VAIAQIPYPPAAAVAVGKKGTNMKSITSMLCALAFLGSVAFASAETCCEKAKAEGKDCAHKCCIAAKKDGKVCEKCNPKKDK
jgi:hypothetical protein